MKVTNEALNEFKEIYKEEYGIELSDKEALSKSIRILTLFRAIYKPININMKNYYGKPQNAF